VRSYLAAAMPLFVFLLLAVPPSNAGENLKINPKLDYSSDSIDGPLITGDHMDAGAAQDRVNYVLMYVKVATTRSARPAAQSLCMRSIAAGSTS